MSFINITTNNASNQLSSKPTFVDNYVYVPGTTKTGEWRHPYVFTSLQDFKDTCGIGSPEGSITYEYVAGLLSSGLPVIFQRIVATDQVNEASKANPTLGVTSASAILSHTGAEDATIQDVKISEKFGGTYGNSLNFTINVTANAYFMSLYYDTVLLEKKKLISYTSADTEEMIASKLIDALKTVIFDRIDIAVLNDDPTKFVLTQVANQYLTGGTDFDETLVAAEIPALLNEISDKMLYQPLFITSGGYTDADVSVSSAIASTMKNLTLSRQDCRALIDLPLGTGSDEVQSLADALSYIQKASNTAIPSASICAPWAYMQVGSNSLWMPASYAYLTVVGDALSDGGKVYTPKAGLINGTVRNIIKPEYEVGSTISDRWQAEGETQVNPIMKLQGGNYIIGGNSTLLKTDAEESNAFSESTIDLTVITIRRFVFNKGMELQYQYNSGEAFEDFSLSVSSLLDKMTSDGAVIDYKITNISTDDEPRILKIRLDVDLTPTIKGISIYLNVSYGSVQITSGGEE